MFAIYCPKCKCEEIYEVDVKCQFLSEEKGEHYASYSCQNCDCYFKVASEFDISNLHHDIVYVD
jgi:hypothetical protein